MSILQPRIPGSAVLDLFAGSGAVGLELLSRGASSVVFVERSRRAARVLERNIRTLNAADTSVVAGDAMAYISKLSHLHYDLAVADPPYGEGLASRLMDRYLQSPFARELWVEHRRDESLPDAPGTTRRRYGDTVLTGVAVPQP